MEATAASILSSKTAGVYESDLTTFQFSFFIHSDMENRKFANFALIERFLPLARKPCLSRHRAPGMETEITSGGSKERYFSSIYRASYVHAFFKRETA